MVGEKNPTEVRIILGVGVIDKFDLVLAALLESAESTGAVLAKSDMDVASLVTYLQAGPDQTSPNQVGSTQGRDLDDYIETQVHGVIDLTADIDGLVLDPSFRGTPTGESLFSVAERYDFAVALHPGFELTPDQIPPDSREPEPPSRQARRRLLLR